MTERNTGFMTNNYVNFDFGGEKFTFFISDEDSSIINTSEIKEYDEKAKGLTDAASDVLRDKMFGEVDIRRLSDNYAFHPFDYQIDNVAKMLNRFRGKGVFGDQVGLGKTIEALMTAHAMFASGSIRNALLIVGKKTIPGWVSEILMKFPDIFKIHIAETALDLDRNGDNDDVDIVSVRNIASRHPDAVEIISFDKKAGKGASASRRLDVFTNLVERMARDNERTSTKGEKFRLYIATEEMLAVSRRVLEEMRENSYEREGYESEIQNFMSDAIVGLGNLMDSLDVLKNGEDDFINAFDDCYKGVSGRVSDPISYKVLVEKIETNKNSFAAKALRDMLREKRAFYDAQKSGRFIENARKKKNLEYIDSQIQLIDDVIEIFDERMRVLNGSRDLFSGERIIDLMLIDEIHKLYAPNSAENHVAPMASYISDIQKKFCVLISATPVRTRLDDIFELLYIANPKMFGSNDIDIARGYFYRTLCRIGKPEEYLSQRAYSNGKFPLADMVLEGNDISKDISEEKLKVFLGLVNSFFTRKRISDVSKDMQGGIYALAFSELSPKLCSILENLSSVIIYKRSVMYTKRERNADDAERLAFAEWNEWHKSTSESKSKLFLDLARAEHGKGVSYSELEESRKNKVRHFYSSVDATLIELIKTLDELTFKEYQGVLTDSELSNVSPRLQEGIVLAYTAYITGKSTASVKNLDAALRRIKAVGTKSYLHDLRTILREDAALRDFKRLLYSAVNWQRRGKFGAAFIPDKAEEARIADKYGIGEYGARARNLVNSLSDAVLRGSCKTKGGSFIYPDGKQPDGRYDDDFLLSILFDTVMAYFSKDSDGEYKGGARGAAMDAMKAVSEEQIKLNEAFVARFGEERKVDIERAMGRNNGDLQCGEEVNRVAFVDANYQAGINLQQYKSFIFYQMDSRTQKLLSPVDIEQWIGRIHRTGQVKNCRVLTVLDHYLRRGTYEPDFLIWYYELLSDPQGLDLYGNNTPDVAFIQPIVSDCVRKALHSKKVRAGLNDCGFVDLARKCYDYDKRKGGNEMKDNMKSCIRQLCRVPGFGRGGDAVASGYIDSLVSVLRRAGLR